MKAYIKFIIGIIAVFTAFSGIYLILEHYSENSNIIGVVLIYLAGIISGILIEQQA